MSDSCDIAEPFLQKGQPGPESDFWAELHHCGLMEKGCADFTRVWSILGVFVSLFTCGSFGYLAYCSEHSLPRLTESYGKEIVKVVFLCTSGSGFFNALTLIAMTWQVRKDSNIRRCLLGEYKYEEGRAPTPTVLGRFHSVWTDRARLYVDWLGLLVRVPVSFAAACVLAQVWNGVPWLMWLGLVSVSVGLNVSQPIFMNMVDLQTDLSTSWIRRIINDIKGFKNNTDDEHYWAKVVDRYRTMRILVFQVWDESTFFNLSYNALATYCAFLLALTSYARLRDGDLSSGLLLILLTLLSLVCAGGNLRRMESISTLATTVKSKTREDGEGEHEESIPNAAMVFTGIEGRDMSDRQKLDHVNFMTVVSRCPTGARVIVTIDTQLVIKLAAPALSALVTAFTYALTIIGDKPSA